MYLRSYLKETPVFKAMQERKQLYQGLPVKEVFAKLPFVGGVGHVVHMVFNRVCGGGVAVYAAIAHRHVWLQYALTRLCCNPQAL